MTALYIPAMMKGTGPTGLEGRIELGRCLSGEPVSWHGSGIWEDCAKSSPVAPKASPRRAVDPSPQPSSPTSNSRVLSGLALGCSIRTRIGRPGLLFPPRPRLPDGGLRRSQRDHRQYRCRHGRVDRPTTQRVGRRHPGRQHHMSWLPSMPARHRQSHPDPDRLEHRLQRRAPTSPPRTATSCFKVADAGRRGHGRPSTGSPQAATSPSPARSTAP